MKKAVVWYVWADHMGAAQVYTLYVRTHPPRPSQWSRPLITQYTTKESAVTDALTLAGDMAERECPVQVNIQGKASTRRG
jgi:hypothetical protein